MHGLKNNAVQNLARILTGRYQIGRSIKSPASFDCSSSLISSLWRTKLLGVNNTGAEGSSPVSATRLSKFEVSWNDNPHSRQLPETSKCKTEFLESLVNYFRLPKRTPGKISVPGCELSSGLQSGENLKHRYVPFAISFGCGKKPRCPGPKSKSPPSCPSPVSCPRPPTCPPPPYCPPPKPTKPTKPSKPTGPPKPNCPPASKTPKKTIQWKADLQQIGIQKELCADSLESEENKKAVSGEKDKKTRHENVYAFRTKKTDGRASKPKRNSCGRNGPRKKDRGGRKNEPCGSGKRQSEGSNKRKNNDCKKHPE